MEHTFLETLNFSLYLTSLVLTLSRKSINKQVVLVHAVTFILSLSIGMA